MCALSLRSVCACEFGLNPTSVLPGNVGPDESQCPLHTLFLSILLHHRGRPEAREEEGELPAGPVAVLAAVHGIEQRLCAVLRPQAVGKPGGGGRRAGADGCSAGARPKRGILFGCV